MFPRIVLVMAALAMLVPITGAYFWSLLLMGWLVVTRPWRLDADDGLNAALRPIGWGALALIGTQVLASLLSFWTSPYAAPLGKVLKISTHQGTKLAMLWFVLIGAHKALARRGFTIVRQGAPWLCGFMVLHLIYCFAQRQWGIDWTHGFKAHLPSHRFAYGVYRVSGFEGHPLTLSYNLMLVVVAATWVVSHARRTLSSRQLRCWYVILATALVALVITGSRFPLVALASSLLICEWRRLWRYKAWVLGLAAVMTLALWMEGSTFGRVAELFDPNIPFDVRFSRLVFWRTHWRMFLDYPVGGVGMAALDRAYADYYAGIVPPDQQFTAHNIFLQLLADTGLIGLAGLLALIVGYFAAARRLDGSGRDGSALRYLAAAAVMSGLLQNNFRDSEFLYVFWFLTATLAVSLLTAPRAESPRTV